MPRTLMLLTLLILAGCAVSNPPPVVDLSSNQSRPKDPVNHGQHTVQRGETLYSIAWRYGWDYRELARANNINSPYTIYPGQRIALDKTPSAPSAPARPASSSASTQVTAAPPPSRPKPAEPARPAASTPPASTSSQPASKPAAPAPRPPAASGTTSGPVQWRWPASGPLEERFSTSSGGRRGIAIGGAAGSPVRAAAAGRVVYRGSGLTGYGNLLIIKHDDRWLSAYAHNDRMSVAEGEAVSAGQQIATMGSTGTYKTQLHFEIRRDGQPVDPLAHLPKRD